MKVKYSYLLFLILIFPCINSCDNPTLPDDIDSEASFTEEIEIVEEVEIPVVRFEANDSASLGSGVWYIEEDSMQDPFETLEISIKKESGYNYGQYGVVFCYQDDYNYYLFTIDSMGGYKFERKINGYLYDIIPYATTENLSTGYDVNNMILIERNTADGFIIKINGTQTNSIVDYSYFLGQSGYFVYVASENHERFPEVPVVVVFEKL